MTFKNSSNLVKPLHERFDLNEWGEARALDGAWTYAK